MAFKILVCAKQVPDTNEIRINPETGTLIRDGVPSILNNDDANALEEALKIKDKGCTGESAGEFYAGIATYMVCARVLPHRSLHDGMRLRQV